MGVFFSSIFSRLFGKREMRLLMIGLQAVGKTTILYKLNLQLGEVATPIPTIGFNVETFEYKNISFTVWDVGYQSIIISLWKPYFKDTKGLIFVVDCNDHERIELAAEALKMVMEDDEMRDVVLLVLANKQDLPEAMTVSELTDRLGLHTLRGRQWFVQPTCAVQGSGLYEGLDWLSDQLSKQQ